MSDHQVPDEDLVPDPSTETGAAATLLQRASGPATADELEAAGATISRFVEVVLEPVEIPPTRRLRAIPVPARAAAVIVAATLWSTGIAAAATGHLPDGFQHAVSNTAAHIGLSLPDPADVKTVDAADEGNRSTQGDRDEPDTSAASTASTAASTTSPTTTATSSGGSIAAASSAGTVTSTTAAGASTTLDDSASRGVGPDVNGPAHDGLCNAYLRGLATGHPKNPDAPPWRNLIAGAKQAGKSVEAFCGSTTAAAATTVAPVASTESTSSTSSTTTTTAATTTTIEAEGKAHGGGNGNGNGHGNGGDDGNGGGPHP